LAYPFLPLTRPSRVGIPSPSYGRKKTQLKRIFTVSAMGFYSLTLPVIASLFITRSSLILYPL